MYLKRIELAGFKSFPLKTRLDLEPGVSCIVGPNGSGKSNVSDAIRWVLGESSARNIRGNKLEDVIFSGSKKRRPLGMAEVSLILDNSDAFVNLPFSEVSITRRALRGGGSEYFINNKSCRLKDIRELFQDTGVGVEGFSLIDQGRVNELISARADERRELVEEAAGVVRYRERKREAGRRLAETEAHLTRLADLLFELGGRIDPLRQQAEKARTYLDLKKDADHTEIAISVKVLTEAGDAIDQLEQRLKELEQSILAAESKRLTAASEEEALAAAIAGRDAAAAAAAERYHSLQTQREAAEGQLKLTVQKKETSTANRQRLEGELSAHEEAIAAKKAEAEAMAEHIRRTEEELAEQRRSLLASGDGESLRQAADALGREFGDLREKAAAIAAEAAAAQRSAEEKEDQKNRRMEALAAAEAAMAAHVEEAEKAAAEAIRLLAECEEMAKGSLALSAALNENEQQVRSTAAALQDAAAEEADVRFRCHSQQTRVNMLQELADNNEAFFPGVRALLNAKKSGDAPRGVLGVAASLLVVPEEYRVAVEAYLGANLQNIVCETEDSAKACIRYLKEGHLGRATFLPLDVLRPREAPDLSGVLGQKGVLGRASDLVSTEARLSPVREYLLNSVVVAKDLDAATAAAKKLRYKVAIVTLDGDLVAPGAAMSGGSRGKKAGELLSQKARLEDAKADLAKLQKEAAEKAAILNECRQAAEAAASENQRLTAALREENERVGSRRREQEQAAFREAAAKERLTQAEADCAQLKRELSYAEAEAEEARNEALRLQTEEQELGPQLESLSCRLEDALSLAAGAEEDMTQARVAAAAGEEKLKGQRLTLEKLETEINDLGWEAETCAGDLAEETEQLALCAKEEEAAQTALADLNTALLAAGEAMEAARQDVAEENARLQELRVQQKLLTQELDKGRNESHQLALRRERWQADFENEAAKLTEAFSLTLEEAKEKVGTVPGRTTLQQKLSQLKREIAALGNVNIDAIQEFAEVNARYEFLTIQQQDMTDARAKLDQVISEMDQVIVTRFKETFSALSDAFRSSFIRLFGGGDAALSLTDPEDLLHTGVELSVSLPGKRVSQYNLLSGGEKTLVGVALMFALLTIRPAPFCVMDEVDAALDEANIGRFTDYLQEKSASSQFLMISHRQTTMEAANRLWGVTMEEEGVSKVISVKLTELNEAKA